MKGDVKRKETVEKRVKSKGEKVNVRGKTDTSLNSSKPKKGWITVHLVLPVEGIFR